MRVRTQRGPDLAIVCGDLWRGQGFEVNPATPLFVFMGRLDAQKGVDILFEAVDAVLKGGLDVQFVFMGSGIEELEEVLPRPAPPHPPWSTPMRARPGRRQRTGAHCPIHAHDKREARA